VSRLDGTVAVVAVPSGANLARRLVSAGATVVVTGGEAGEVGRLIADLSDGPGRIAYYQGDPDSDALIEFINEQFGERPPVS
jgi:NAD(P)-dependent dehydrogenase (short-subunit alcohol dehydrogenase family)